MILKVFNAPLDRLPHLPGHAALCLGYFDGVHQGHQAIINEALKNFHKVYVLTFDHTPKYVLGLTKSEEVLTSVADKARILEAMGVSALYVATFDKPFAAETADQFIQALNGLNPDTVFCGPDYRFGQLAKGDVSLLSSSKEARFDTVVVDEVSMDGHKVSSRDIIKLVQDGQIKDAERFMGRPYSVSGQVVKGLQNGRKIGFPTANLQLNAPYVIPKSGVYATRVHIGNKVKWGVTYVGTHPTIAELAQPGIETYVLNYWGNLYKKTIRVEFIDFLRGDMVFGSLNELKQQIAKDVKATRALKG